MNDDSDVDNGDNTPETGTVIKIDGDFSDWSQEGVVSSFSPLSGYDAVSEIRACMSNKYLYVYYKSAKLSLLHNLRVCVDADDDLSTGDSYPLFPDKGFSIMFNFTSVDSPAGCSAYTLILGGDSYLSELADFTKGEAVINGDTIESEIGFERSKIEAVAPFSGDNVKIEFYALGFDWALTAVIPSDQALSVTVQK